MICYHPEVIRGSHPYKERLDHAVGFPALRMTAITVNGRLNDSHNVITELQLEEI